MFDPTTVTPDALPLTGYPYLDAVVKIAGALGIIATALATVLPKTWPFVLWLAQHASDLRGIVPKAAAVNEARAQQIGRTTVSPALAAEPPPPAPDVLYPLPKNPSSGPQSSL